MTFFSLFDDFFYFNAFGVAFGSLFLPSEFDKRIVTRYLSHIKALKVRKR